MPLPFSLTAAVCRAVRRALVPGVMLALAGCASFPEIDAASRRLPPGPPPVLLPMDDILAQVAGARATPQSAAALLARAANLRARAALMRGPVADPVTRARLAARR